MDFFRDANARFLKRHFERNVRLAVYNEIATIEISIFFVGEVETAIMFSFQSAVDFACDRFSTISLFFKLEVTFVNLEATFYFLY